VTPTVKLDLDIVKMNRYDKYLDKRLFCWKVNYCLGTHTHTDSTKCSTRTTKTVSKRWTSEWNTHERTDGKAASCTCFWKKHQLNTRRSCSTLSYSQTRMDSVTVQTVAQRAPF